MKALKQFSFLVMLSLLAFSCKKGSSVIDPTPVTPTGSLTITGISPDYGKAGVEVTITGTGFSTTASANTVTIGDKAATVTSATATQLKITAPADGTHGFVTVKSGTLSATGAIFYYEPEITSLSVTTGKSGDAVTITGKNFGTTATDFEVKFNGVVAEITAATLTTLAVKVPATATTGAITVARKTKTAITGPAFTITTTTGGGSSTAFTVTDGSITITNILKSTGTYGVPLCFTIDETNSIMYVGTKTNIIKIDLATNATTNVIATSSFLPTTAQPSAMDVGPGGKLYLLTDLVTLGGIPATGTNVFYINTTTNTATAVGNRYIGINIGGYLADNIPFMVNADSEFFVMDGSVGTMVKYSSDLSVRTVLFSVAGTETFHHMIKNPNSNIRMMVTTVTGTGKSYYDYFTGAVQPKVELAAALATNLQTIAWGGTVAYGLQSKNAPDASATSTHMIYTIGKVNTGFTDFDKKASFTIDKFNTVSTVKYYNFIPLNGKTYFYADKNGNMYAIVSGVGLYADMGIFKFSIN